MNEIAKLAERFGVMQVKAHYDRDEESYWVGIKEDYCGMPSQLAIARGMTKGVAGVVLKAVRAEWVKILEG